jgi:ketosteroid isomerase-like protein
MSDENVAVVRGYFDALNRWLASYWADPSQPLERAAGLDEVTARLDPEAEWDWLFSSEIFRGPKRMMVAVSDWLESVSDWQLEIEELIAGRGDRVLSVARVLARGRGSGAPIDQPVFTAVTVREGRVARIEDFTDRAAAYRAVGLDPDCEPDRPPARSRARRRLGRGGAPLGSSDRAALTASLVMPRQM